MRAAKTEPSWRCQDGEQRRVDLAPIKGAPDFRPSPMAWTGSLSLRLTAAYVGWELNLRQPGGNLLLVRAPAVGAAARRRLLVSWWPK